MSFGIFLLNFSFFKYNDTSWARLANFTPSNEALTYWLSLSPIHPKNEFNPYLGLHKVLQSLSNSKVKKTKNWAYWMVGCEFSDPPNAPCKRVKTFSKEAPSNTFHVVIPKVS
jgi:hypothetical protein